MTAFLVDTLLASALLMLGVMALRPLLRRHVGARWVYALWALPALRLLVPPLPWLPARTDIVTAMGDRAPALVPSGWDLRVIAACWLAGAVLYFALQMRRYVRFMTTARANAVGKPRIHRAVRVQYSAAVNGPIAGGLQKRTVFLPLDFAHRFDAQERRLALAHELMHHRRGDVLANLVAVFVLSLHWFNTVAHYAYRLFRADQELACDADVLAAKGRGCRMAYGQVLLKAGVGMPAAFCGLSGAALLKARLLGLAVAMPQRTRLLTYAGVIGAGFVLMASAVERPHQRTAIGTTTGTASSRPVTPESAIEDLPAAERLGRPSYLQHRRELGLARSLALRGTPADAVPARGQHLVRPPPPD